MDVILIYVIVLKSRTHVKLQTKNPAQVYSLLAITINAVCIFKQAIIL